jgi:eukaryotic-like serine/threonine-protein kinase
VQIGRNLADRYTLVQPLAEGGMSMVWVAYDKRTGLDVAVKAISLDAAGWRAEVRDRFMKEARLLALGRHEHLVDVLDVGETDDGFLYLVLELLHGETLAERISREGVIRWEEAGSIGLGITRGVAALHKAGVVHRDLKPGNIILCRGKDGLVPKIIDLGISKVRAAAADPVLSATLTATGQVLGTPEYMSYEQALGERDIDERADVWALGVILYEMLAGRRPFMAPNVNAVLAAIRRREEPKLAEVNKDVPGPLVEVVDRCLATERGDRYKDADELSEALLAALARVAALGAEAVPAPVSAPMSHKPRAGSSSGRRPALPEPPPKPPPEPPPKTRTIRRKHVIMGGFVALAAAAAILASGVSRNDRQPIPAVTPAASVGAGEVVNIPASLIERRDKGDAEGGAAAASASAAQPAKTGGEAAPKAAPSVKSKGPAPRRDTGSGKPPVTRVNESGL